MKRIVVLVTDFGARGTHYVAAMKGRLLGGVNSDVDVEIVDGTHAVRPFDVLEGAFFLEYLAPVFPPGSVFIVVVDPGVGGERGVLVGVTRGGKYFVGPDNGVFTGLFRFDPPSEVALVPVNPNGGSRASSVAPTFHGRDVMAPVAARLVNGESPQDIGKPTTAYVTLPLPAPEVLAGGEVRCHARYVDEFGNVVTDIGRQFFEEHFSATNRLRVRVHGVQRPPEEIPLKMVYEDVELGESLALFGSFDRLELSVNRGNFAGPRKIVTGTEIIVGVVEDGG
ncbi:MAG: SAM hydrolase/SAM-dependent halogenase family protein [Promethearchaeota archaeon]